MHLFDEIKRVYQQKNINSVQTRLELAQENGEDSDLAKDNQQTRKEWMVFLLNIRSGIKAIKASLLAKEKSVEKHNCGTQGDLQHNQTDAVRHAYWNALMVKEIGEDLAKEIADAHEVEDKDKRGVAMDLQ